VTWDDFFSPTKPTIGAEVYHLLLPAVLQLDKFQVNDHFNEELTYSVANHR
jgi:hypothetical protein